MSTSSVNEVAQHTPGPWTVEPMDNPMRRSIEPGIGIVLGVGRGPIANARLIAAAPDLLQALHEIAGDCYALDGSSPEPHCRFCDHSEGAKHDPDCVMQIVNEAIAKAEGSAQ